MAWPYWICTCARCAIGLALSDPLDLHTPSSIYTPVPLTLLDVELGHSHPGSTGHTPAHSCPHPPKHTYMYTPSMSATVTLYTLLMAYIYPRCLFLSAHCDLRDQLCSQASKWFSQLPVLPGGLAAGRRAPGLPSCPAEANFSHLVFIYSSYQLL